MYRTMEMRVEPKLSYPERLVISGSKRKIWFGYFLFAMNSVVAWFKEEFISGVLKVLCFSALVVLIVGGFFGIIYLLSLVPGKIVAWTMVAILSAILIYIIQMVARIMIKETISDLNEKANALKEAALQKLGPPTPICCELFGPPVTRQRVEIGQIRFDLGHLDAEHLKKIRKDIQELQEHILDQHELLLKELENV